MDVDKNQFRKTFPNLAEEMSEPENDESKLSFSSVRSDSEAGENLASEKFEGYNPNVIDFLRRCDYEKQGEEIIDFLEKKKEIDCEFAERLRKQLREEGIRSFGSKKEDSHYLQEAGF